MVGKYEVWVWMLNRVKILQTFDWEHYRMCAADSSHKAESRTNWSSQ